MNTKKIDQDSIKNTYDEFPYDGYPFSDTRPEHCSTIAKLFGVTTADIESARVLELGCANGGNLINFAFHHPKSYTLGVDLSKLAIDDGNKVIKELKLKNIELKHLSITDLDESFGKFDYIICHGVFSWVPDEVKQHILKVLQKLLNKNGVAIISYNTFPGWNMTNTIRDMMLFHALNFDNVQDKVSQARLFLDFVDKSLEGSNSPYAKFLSAEAKHLTNYEDQYLRHEYLAEENKPFYFNEFVSMISPYGLQYLGDVECAYMFIGNLPKVAAEKLSAIGDIVRTEQYMDFIVNRRFRSSIICHNDVKIDRNITDDRIKQFYATANIFTEKPETSVDIKNSEELKFQMVGSEEHSIATVDPIMKAIFYTYIENKGNPLTVSEVSTLAHKKLPSAKIEDIEKGLLGVAARLVFSGYLRLFATKPKAMSTISSHPKVSDLALHQLKNAKPNKVYVTNNINEIIALSPHEQIILSVLDGSHSLEQITEIILAKLSSGELQANDGDKKITEKAAEQVAKLCVANALERFRTSYVLVG